MLSITKKKKDSSMDEDYFREMNTPECSSSDDDSYQKKYREILDSKKKVYNTHFALNT
jgi:phosphoribosylaminoimidazole-succinocarboxamide synthase